MSYEVSSSSCPPAGPECFAGPCYLVSSGHSEASQADRRTTQRLKECGRLLGLGARVEEHLTLGHHGQFSRVE